MIQTVLCKTERRDDDRRLAFLKVKLVLVQVLLLLCQVAVCHFVFKHGHVVAALVHQRYILIGHFKMSSWEEKGLLLL